MHKTAVTTPFGLFNFTQTRNSGQTFQRFIDFVTRGLDFVFVYLDDLLVTSRDHRTHKKHLQIWFTCLAEYGIIIGPEKKAVRYYRIKLSRSSRLLRGHFAITQRSRRNSKFR